MVEKHREKGEITKRKIKACAKELFFTKGFDNTPVREIVKSAGVAKGTFYLYYDTKYDVFSEILMESMGVISILIEDAIDVNNPSIEQIENFIEKVVLFMVEHKEEIEFYHKSSVLDLLMESNLINKFENDMIGPITRTLEKGIEKGIFRKMDAKVYANIIYSITHNMLESAMLYNYPTDIYKIKEELKLIIRKILC